MTETLNTLGNDANTNLPIQIFPSIGVNQYTITNIIDANGCTNPAQNNVLVTVILPPNAGSPTYSLNGAPFFTGGDINGSWEYQGTSPPTPYPFGTFQAWNPVLNAPVDPFGTYRYTVSDPSGTCPNDWQDITITSETAPNTGNALAGISICINDYNLANPYNLNNLLDGTQDPGGNWYFNGSIIAGGVIDPNNAIYNIGPPGNTFSYEIPITSVCTNNGSGSYITQVTLTIHPEPVIDLATFVANPANIVQYQSTDVTVDMTVGTPPFTVYLSGNETPPPLGPGQSSGVFSILSGMSGFGAFYPNYDPNVNPVLIGIDSIVDGNGCATLPVINTPVDIDPFPTINSSVSNNVVCEPDLVNLILEGVQGIVPLDVYYTINGLTQTTATINNLSFHPLTVREIHFSDMPINSL